MKHKIFTMLLALMSTSCLWAESGTCGENLTWTFQNGVLTISGTGDMSNYGYYDERPWDFLAITSVVIGNNVTSIGNHAFNSCHTITSVSLPNSVTSIGLRAFMYCSNLSTISIPTNVTSIGDYAFSNCSSFTSITIPYGVTSIGKGAFYECSNLESITIPYGITSIKESTFKNCSTITSITLPYSVTSIEKEAFSGCSSLTSINIPDNVTSIGDMAFASCSDLETIIIPRNVTNYGNRVLNGCSGLTSITCKIPTPPALYSNLDFCSFDIPLYVPAASVELYRSASTWGRFTDIRVIIIASGSCGPNVVWTLEDGGHLTISGDGNMYNWASSEDEYPSWSNYSNQITSVIIKDGVTSIGDEAFSHCNNLTTISIPNSVTSIGYLAFYGCSNLSSITLPYGITQIESHTFSDCSGLSSITIPNSVTTIKDYAFLRCSGLSSITIPNSVTRIWDKAFFGCSGLASISVQTGNPKYDSRDNCNAIIETAKNKLLVGCKNTTISNTITSIASAAFTDCSGLSSITIPNSVTSIGEMAFYGCSGLTSITIPNSVTIIGRQAFYQCSSLASIEIGASVTSVGTDVFRNCTQLKTVKCYAIAPPTAGYSDFYGLPYNSVLYVLNESLSSYAAATGWSSFGNRIRSITKTATIGSTGWTTFSCDEPLDLNNMDASTGTSEAYYAYNAAGSTVNLRSTTATVPAGEGLMLKGENGATITIPIASSGTSIDGNKLVGCPSGATITTSTPDYKDIYVLANNNGTAQFENVQSYVASHTLSIGAGKAYLKLDGITLAPGALGIVFEEDNATKLEALSETDKAVKFIENGQLLILRDGVTYDAMGRVIR